MGPESYDARSTTKSAVFFARPSVSELGNQPLVAWKHVIQLFMVTVYSVDDAPGHGGGLGYRVHP